MRFGLLAVALGVGGSFLACGTAPCSQSTCSTGCCDASGRCQPGNVSGACGSQGNRCVACSLGASCSFGTCLGSGAGTSGSGGGSSGTGGGSSGTGGGSSGTGGGSSGTGGGSSGTGGGSSGTGGGSSGTGGGSSGTGGGASGTGGGSSGTGGGLSGTGGGLSGTGGGSSGTGGGSGFGQPCDFVSNPTCPTGSACVVTNASSSAGTCIEGCSLTAQDCSGSSKCMIGSVDGGVRRLCVPFTLGTGGLQEGATCTPGAMDPCVRGAQCLSVSGQASCRQFCSPTVGCMTGALCNVAFTFPNANGTPGEIHPVCGAVTMCDPFTQAPCASGQACALVASGQPPVCVPSGTVTEGGACTATARCEPGLQCIGNASAAFCRAFCSPGGFPACVTGTCMALPGSTYGVCQ